MAASGCIAVTGGLEVASDRLLAKMKKGVDIAQVTRVTHHFSKNNMANQLAQNTLFFLGKSIIEYYQEEKFSSKYVITDLEKLDKIYNDNRNKNNGKRLDINLKKINKKPPNIILIILESFVSENCNFLNPKLNEKITPNLNKIAKNGILFERCFAN